MTDEELIRFGKEVRSLAENRFQRQWEEARAEWKRSKELQSRYAKAFDSVKPSRYGFGSH